MVVMQNDLEKAIEFHEANCVSNFEFVLINLRKTSPEVFKLRASEAGCKAIDVFLLQGSEDGEV